MYTCSNIPEMLHGICEQSWRPHAKHESMPSLQLVLRHTLLHFFLPQQNIICLSTSKYYVLYTHTHTYIHTYTHTHTHMLCMRIHISHLYGVFIELMHPFVNNIDARAVHRGLHSIKRFVFLSQMNFEEIFIGRCGHRWEAISRELLLW